MANASNRAHCRQAFRCFCIGRAHHIGRFASRRRTSWVLHLNPIGSHRGPLFGLELPSVPSKDVIALGRIDDVSLEAAIDEAMAKMAAVP
jgi:hypothetical protein